MHKQVTLTRGALLYAVLALILVNVTVSATGIVYTNYNQRQSDHKWCQLFRDLDRPVDPRITDPKQRERTQSIVAKIHKLRVEYGCVKK
jgi:hypothetical protein